MSHPSSRLQRDAGEPRAEIVVHRDPLDRTTVLQVNGEMNLPTVNFFEAAIGDAVARPAERLLVDLSDCESLDGDALMSIVSARRAMDTDRISGPPLVLVAGPGRVRARLAESGLAEMVPTFADRHAALDVLLGPP
jgi:anti-anti-sigma regulatory factor